MNESTVQTALGFLKGGGEMGRLIREYDWATTPLGSPESWPQSLRTSVSICLSSNFPICIYWGLQHILIYNEAWSSIPGGKHPWALGKTGKEVWPEIWQDIEPWFHDAFQGKPVGSNDQLLFMERHGYPEECFFDFTFTPINGDSGQVEGVFNAVIETTYRVLNERRNTLLQNLVKKLGGASTFEELYQAAMAVFGENKKDIPFVALYTIHNDEAVLQKASFEVIPDHRRLQLGAGNKLSPLEKEVQKMLISKATTRLTGIHQYLKNIPPGVWPEPTHEAVLIPQFTLGGEVSGFLLVGINPRRELDQAYQLFLENAAAAISNEAAKLLSFEEEKKKREALAEIDRAKTIFFSNISHEFRTPLTLMLTPIQDALADPSTIPENQMRLDVAHRNGLRLQKLVNTLLEFSRIEAGRLEGKFVPIDICSFTKDLASTFQSAMEKAGMAYRVQCSNVKDKVYVDTDMWEKIVLNLLSNAFKYSREGSIEVVVQQVGDKVQLSVSDTGAGIPEDQLDKIFERFYRVEGVSGRSQEGSGIGLAMVKELVKQHGGNITVQSELGKGSTFTVEIPVGKEHLKDVVEESALTPELSNQSQAFVQEALRWVPDGKDKELAIIGSSDAYKNTSIEKRTVLLADDNQDMRNYISRLLTPSFNVATASNGNSAFKLANELQPSLIISDAMMPELDGFGLLEKLRSAPATKNIPFIFLSARAGEEARVEGLQAGADDYIIKPFSARELLARVEAQIAISESRDKALKDLYALFDEVPFAVAVLMGPLLNIEFVNKYNLDVWQRTKEEVMGKPLFELFPEMRSTAQPVHEEVYKTGRRFVAKELLVEIANGDTLETRWFDSIVDPIRNERGEITGQIVTTIEVTEGVKARQKIEESSAHLNNIISQVNAGIAQTDLHGRFTDVNERFCEMTGYSKEELLHLTISGITHKEDWPRNHELFMSMINGGSNFFIEKRYLRKDGSLVWVNNGVSLVTGAHGEKFVTAVSVDITDQVLTRKKLEESEERFRLINRATQDAIWDWNLATNEVLWNEAVQHLFGYKPEQIETTAEWWYLHIHPDDRERVVHSIHEVIDSGGEAWSGEYRYLTADGGFKTVFDRGFVLHNEEGKAIRMLGSMQDITQRKQFEASLIESESRFRNLVEDATVAIVVVTGADMKVEVANKAYGKLISRTSHQLIGKPLFSLIPEAEAQYAPILEKVRQSGEPVYLYDSPYTINTADGKPIEGFLNLVYQPYRDAGGSSIGVMAIIQDVTDSVLSRKALAESEERFRTLATSVPQIVWTMDKDGNMDYLSHKWEYYTGQSVDEGLTQRHLMIHPDDLRLVLAQWQRSLKSGKGWKHDYRLGNRITGEYRWFTGITEPLRDDAGNIVRWVGTATDINEQKRFSQALETLVWDRTKALQQSNEDLQQFAHVASHDLKEPVRKVKTFANRLEEELGENISERAKQFLSKVNSATDRMFTMIDGVLAYSSITATAQSLEAVDLNRVMQDIETDLEVPMNQSGATIEYHDLPTLEGAPVLLYQLFYNLVNNSLKFAKADVPPKIVLWSSSKMHSEQPAVQIIFSDNGIGFEQDFAEKIFETFTRLNSKDKYEGTGLGLSLCKKIVERHGGTIKAAGVPGVGATFTIVLPLKQDDRRSV